MGPVLCLVDNVKSVVEDFSLLIATHHLSAHVISLSAACCILYVAVVVCSSLHHIMKSFAYSAAWIPLGSSWMRSFMKTKKSVGERTPPCGASCRSSTFLPFRPLTEILSLLLFFIIFYCFNCLCSCFSRFFFYDKSRISTDPCRYRQNTPILIKIANSC